MNLPSSDVFEVRGFAVHPNAIDEDDCDALIQEHLAYCALHQGRGGRRGGVRSALSHFPTAQRIANSAAVRSIVESVLSPTAFAVRAILFDKTETSNWFVTWHQDTTIAVNQRIDSMKSFGPWSIKEGVVHVQPPSSVFSSMATIRLHLDHCDETNGPLTVYPGSHRFGITSTIPDAITQTTEPHFCTASRGDAVVMHPLIWHSSPKAMNPTHRRILHIEFADCALPEPLKWAEQTDSP